MQGNSFVKRNQILELRIEDYAFGGKGVARLESEKGSFIVFVPNTFPGQLVRARIKKKRKKYAEAKLIEVLELSKNETEVLFQMIPGAPYIKLPIELQHKYKKESTFSVFKRIAEVKNIENIFDEFIASPSIYHYRNKMEYGFSAIGYDSVLKKDKDEFTLGFKKNGLWWMSENLEKDSGLFDKQLEDNLKNIRKYCLNTGLQPWHSPKKEGFFRYFVVRKSYKTNQLLFNLVTTSECMSKFNLKKFSQFLVEIFKDRVYGVLHTINDETGDRTIATTGGINLVYGKDKIVEEILGLNFEISMQSFFQTNTKSAEKLYSKVVEYVLDYKIDEENGIIIDLFCGAGTIGLIIASKSKAAKIIGVEIVPSAIEDAKKNAKINNIEGIKFYTSDVGKFLTAYPQYKEKIYTIVLDPPRAGITPKTLRKIITLNSKRIVYVSCNPATQARDTKLLTEAGYTIKKLSLIDQFPHTTHIETVALFTKN